MASKEELRKKTACFTGHRKIPDWELPTVKERLRQAVITLVERGYRFFGAGGALGFDTLAALTVLNLRAEYPHIKLILVLPCRDQSRLWHTEDAALYNSILARADKVVCMHERNRRLADESSACICYLRHTGGGAAYTVKYAQEVGCEVIPC